MGLTVEYYLYQAMPSPKHLSIVLLVFLTQTLAQEQGSPPPDSPSDVATVEQNQGTPLAPDEFERGKIIRENIDDYEDKQTVLKSLESCNSGSIPEDSNHDHKIVPHEVHKRW